MILLGAQYYRPPTPGSDLWNSDLKAMKEAGLNVIQLWAVWGWIEPEPGKFVYDDYDRLMEIADQEGLKVIISTISDVQPFWMPRVCEYALMVDEQGKKVIGTPRAECLSGITPGCCTDHADVRERTMRFMRELAEHYHDAPALQAWDCWNETRWCVHCESWVCYCEDSLRSYRCFLKKRYGDLEGLGEAWGRRLTSWDDVRPSRAAGAVNPALMDFSRWLIARAADMATWRYKALREGDPDHFISAHSAGPVTNTQWHGEEPPFARGNDFDIAKEVDGYGLSRFPAWFGSDPADYGAIIEVCRSSAAPKPYWNSELQGGAFNQGFTYGPGVSGGLQQCWTWSSIARGAKGVIYWCWRDEIWGVESGGYGIIGQDGYAEDRVRELQLTGRLLEEHEDELDNYQPDAATIGIVFDSDSATLAVTNREHNSEAATQSVYCTMMACERECLAFDVLDGRNLVIPEAVKLLILPAALCLKPEAGEAIKAFAEAGGWVFCDAGTGAFTENAFYHGEAEQRPLISETGLQILSRRGGHIEAPCTIPDDSWGEHDEIKLKSAIWSLILRAPENGRVIASDEHDNPMVVEVPMGKGRIIMSGTFPAHAYHPERYEGFEHLIRTLARESGALPAWDIGAKHGLEDLFVRTGLTNNHRLFFLLNAGEERSVRIKPGEEGVSAAREWTADTQVDADEDGILEVYVPGPGYRVLEWPV